MNTLELCPCDADPREKHPGGCSLLVLVRLRLLPAGARVRAATKTKLVLQGIHKEGDEVETLLARNVLHHQVHVGQTRKQNIKICSSSIF